MNKFSEKEVLQIIKEGKPFEGILEDLSLEIKIKEYVPYLCAAVHSGQNIREDLLHLCLLTPEERRLSEDTCIDKLISSLPAVIISRDSRYEYDIDIEPKNCIYETDLNKKIWSRPLTEKERTASIEKQAVFYKILNALVSVIKEKFGSCLLIGLHSNNTQIKIDSLFSIGISQRIQKRGYNVLEFFEKKLKEIDLPNITTTVSKDNALISNSYLVSYVNENLAKTTLLLLKVKKVYMDEKTGTLFPLVIESLRHGLYNTILSTAAHFSRRLEKVNITHADLLPADLDPVVIKVDRALGKLAGQIDTLHYVNPVNIQQERKKFLSRRGYEPQFHYRQLKIDPYQFREKLYKLPVSQISDPPLREMYRRVVDNFATKIEMLTHVGTPQFLYSSLRYYGEPSSLDIANAKFLLHAAETGTYAEPEQNMKAEQIKAACERSAKELGIECDIVLSSKIVANAMVDGAKRTLLINKNAKISEIELQSLIYHELGVHMTTTINARKQPLKVFILGLPQNTYTQEGLAIFWEHISNSLNLSRLRRLALRTLAVEMMVKGMSFSTVFHRLNNDYHLSIDSAFMLTTRVFRGGGFTKDYLYLSGFRDIVKLASKRDISPLLTGKVSLSFIKIIDQLIERKIVKAPDNLNIYKPGCTFSNNDILNYLVTCIK
ncbi:MAG: flavohemoglobin expression-modulating QEGLA motif protein [Spirochaetia bacterium]|nr:flavohemoglobin expression-modulating QEGLA motif protein [Spirochaetia bacterium]